MNENPDINNDIPVESSTVNYEDHDPNKPVKKTALKQISTFFDFIEILSFSVLTVLLVFTLMFRICRVDGSSMNKTLMHDERIIISDLFYKPKQGDIVVFHLCQGENGFNQPLIKRMIADEGQTVLINITKGEVYVDGEKLTESYTYFKSEGYNLSYFNLENIDRTEDGEILYEVTVPDGKIFVMGDNRNGSTDSRSKSVGFVDKDTILGKALFRISPFTVFK